MVTLNTNALRRRASIVKMRTTQDVIVQAQELDDRRRAQIDQQVASINRYQAYLEQRDLVADFLAWQIEKASV